MRLIPAVGAAVAVWMLVLGGTPIAVPRPANGHLGVMLGCLVIGLATEVPIAMALALGVLPGTVTLGRRRLRRRRVRTATTQRWPDFLAVIRSRLATGEPLPDAVRVAARAAGGEFGVLDRAWAGDFDMALREVQDEWADPTADRVLTTLRIASTTGGARVDSVLAALTGSLSEEIRLRRAHEAAVAQQQMTAGVALLAPWLILALSIATNPQAAGEFATSTGHAVLAGGAVATTIGYVLARRVARLSAPPRVFG